MNIKTVLQISATLVQRHFAITPWLHTVQGLYRFMFKALIVVFFLFLPGSLINAATSSKKNPAPQKQIVQQNPVASQFDNLFRELSRKRGFSGNVLVSMQNNIVYEKSFGFSDRSKKKPLTTHSVFEIASVSKQFTAAAIMMLYEEGKLDYEDTVSSYFPEFPYKDITLRHLLSHRSGLPDYIKFAGHLRINKTGYLTNSELIKILAEHAPQLEFETGENYKYSNTGYALLASIIEVVSGSSFEQFMSERIFEPLDMKNTYVYNPLKHKPTQNETKGYSIKGRPIGVSFLNGVYGDKGIYSSIEDMFKWDQGLYSEKIIKLSTLEKAFIPYSYDENFESDYGFGWRIDTLENGEKIVYHTGWWGGYKSLFLRRLSDHTAIVVLSNKLTKKWFNQNYLIQLLNAGKKS